MTTRTDIVKAARSYLGCRYQHQGRNRVGIDCAGLIVRVAQDCGLPVVDMSGYARTPDGKTLRAALDEQALPIVLYQPGDILLLRFQVDPQHLAIVTEHGMIHSYAGARKVVEHRIDDQWAARIVAAYAFRGVDA